MDEHLTEQQQIEMLKKVWKEYGIAAVTGVCIALAVGFGWRFYQNHVTRRAQSASIIYEGMMMDMMNQQNNEVVRQASYLKQTFSSTPYAKLGAFALAKQYIAQNKYDQASEQYKWVIKHASSDTFEALAKIRLARIYLEEKKPQDALNTLSGVKNKSFSALSSEFKGDAYVQLNQVNQARTSYQSAIDLLPDSAVNKSILQMKLSSLPIGASS